MLRTSFRFPPGTASGAVASLLLALIVAVLPISPALSLAGDANLEPENPGDRAVTIGSKVLVSGDAPEGEITSGTFLCRERISGAERRISLSRRVLNANPVSSEEYVRNDFGELSGRLSVPCPTSDLESDPYLHVRLELVIAGQTIVTDTVPVDTRRPVILRYETVTSRQLRVVFDEAVRHRQGDSPTDWRVTDPANEVTAVSSGGSGDCLRTAGTREREDIPGGETGCTRLLDLAAPIGEDVRPVVHYRPTESTDGGPETPTRRAHEDYASNNALSEGGIYDLRAIDLIRPALPRIDSVEGKSPGSSAVVGSDREPTATVSNVTDGHTVRLETATPDGQALVGPWVSAAGGTAQPTVGPLPDPDATYDLKAVVRDPAGNRSDEADKSAARTDAAPSVVAYRLDLVAPTPTYAVADGRFVTVRFSEAIAGSNRPEDWKVTSGGPVESVSGSGDTRVIRTAAPAGGNISYSPPAATDSVAPYRDAAGNPLAAFTLAILRPGELQVADVSATEGQPLVFTVTMARPDQDDATYSADFATEDGTATAGEDYTARSGRLTFSGSETSKTVSVPTSEDDADEGSETMRLRLSDPRGGATLPDPATATGTILDPDAVVATEGLSVFDTRAHEGSTARAVIQLAKVSTEDVTVRWATQDGTAKAGSDYRASSGTARIPEGARETVVTVPLVDDEIDEPTERFTIQLSDAVNASLARATATVSILDGTGVAPGIGRVSGPSRVETSAQVSKAFFATADTVVVATANAYPDALAGAPLAEKHAAPILLTTRERLHPAIVAEVKRLGASTAYVLGGPAALSSQVDQDLRASGVETVHRLAGENRFDTARRIAAEVGGDAVYVVEGNNRDPKRGWPDAVAVSALAAAQQRPILLVERDRLPAETSAALHRLSPSRATIVGGPAAVNDDVRRAVDQRAGNVDRVAGRTRYETSRAVASRAVAAGFDPGNTFFATGDDWPDSLSASPAVARTGGILLLVDSDRLDDSPPAREWLVTHRDRLRSITLIGGPKAISENVSKQIQSQSGLTPR